MSEEETRRQIREDLERDPYMEGKERYVIEGEGPDQKRRDNIIYFLRHALPFKDFAELQCPINEMYLENNGTITQEMIDMVFNVIKTVNKRRYRK